MIHPVNFLASPAPVLSAKTTKIIGITLVMKADAHMLKFVGSLTVNPELTAPNTKTMNGMMANNADNAPKSFDIALAMKATIPAIAILAKIVLASNTKLHFLHYRINNSEGVP